MGLETYHHGTSEAPHTHSYLMPCVLRMLERHSKSRRVFELGCGNGAYAAQLASVGYDVTGVDPSSDGISFAAGNGLNLSVGSSEEDLAARFGTFDTVLSLEVAEHVFSPKLFASRIHDLLEPGGNAIISTPYHSYLKNLALAVSGKMDFHFTALWEGGHIKFWSRDTLGQLFASAGMREVDFERVGRIPPLAKSMVAVYTKIS